MHKLFGVMVVVLLVTCSCTSDTPRAFDGFRDVDPEEVVAYRVEVSQKREAKGLGDPKTLASKVILDIEEEPTEVGYAVVVRDVSASGEASQVTAAQRLKGRRLTVDLEEGAVSGVVELFSGSEDVAAADIGLLNVLFAPVLREPRSEIGETWRAKTPSVTVPWAKGPLAFTVSHDVIGSGVIRDLEVARVKSSALTNVRFSLPLVEQATPGSPGSPATPGTQPTFIVNELFERLFADVSDPIHAGVAAIAAIPLAIAAPFIAIGEALGCLFGCKGSSGSPATPPSPPQIPIVDLAGPLEITSNTVVWRADGRVLEATAKGTSELSGALPQLTGGAAELSGKPLTLRTTYSIRRTTSPWPEPRPIPGRPLVLLILALIAVTAGAAAASLLQRRQRTVKHAVVRDVAPPVREPQTVDA